MSEKRERVMSKTAKIILLISAMAGVWWAWPSSNSSSSSSSQPGLLIPRTRTPSSVPPVRAPVPFAKPKLKVVSANRLDRYLPQENALAKTLLEGFKLASAADSSPQAQAQLKAFAERNFRSRERTLLLAQYGLRQLPNSAAFARERAGLLSALDEYGPEDAATADVFHQELLTMEQSVRPDLRDTTSETERNQALSENMQEAQCEIAFAGWLHRQDRFSSADREVVEIFTAVQDPLLRQQFYRAIIQKWPESQGVFEFMLDSAGLPVDRIRYE